MPDHRIRRAAKPQKVGQVPDSLAERMGPGLTEAMNVAIEEHPDFPLAFLPPDVPGVSVASLNNWVGAETKR